jgi:hypothetical protein
LKAANLLLRFLLELTALAALGYWGSQRGTDAVTRVSLAVLLPLAAATFWGLFVAPRARFGGRRGVRLLLGLLVFGLASAAIGGTGSATLGWSFAAMAVINTALTYAWGPQPGETSPAA